MMSITQRVLSAIAGTFLMASTALAAETWPATDSTAPDQAHASAKDSFVAFDARAAVGEKLNIVFFGASLTWGANATFSPPSSPLTPPPLKPPSTPIPPDPTPAKRAKLLPYSRVRRNGRRHDQQLRR